MLSRIMLILTLVGLIGCGDNQTPEKLIIGAWTTENTTIKFTDSGQYVINDGTSLEAGHYGITGESQLNLRQGDTVRQGTLTITDDVLTFNDGTTVIYNRKTNKVDLTPEESLAIANIALE